VIDEDHLIDDRVLCDPDDIRRAYESVGLPADPLAPLTDEQMEVLKSVDMKSLTTRPARMHLRTVSFSSGRRGVIGCRTEQTKCGPVKIEHPTQQHLCIEHLLGETI
jgi:hypothetical protein